MEFTLNDALEFVAVSSKDKLRKMTREELILISSILPPEDFQEFIIAKNVKICGGINKYVNDFFAKDTINKIINMQNVQIRSISIDGAILTLNKMLMYEDLQKDPPEVVNEKNRNRITEALDIITPMAAAAATGGHVSKKKRQTRKRGFRRGL